MSLVNHSAVRFLSQAPRAALAGKKVLVRADFNLPITAGKVTNDFRIHQTLPTFKLLLEAGATVTAISHHSGRDQSLAPVVEHLRTIAPRVQLLENLRFDPGEEENNWDFATRLAAGYDLFINDAFAASHRKHASIVGLPRLLPGYAGLLLEKEITELSRAFQPEHPFIFILGGIKFGTKVPLVEKFLNLADKIFIGGALANSFFKAQGREVKQSVVDDNLALLQPFLHQPKIILPGEVVWSENKIVDVAPEALEPIAADLASAKLVLWNGPLGHFEAGFGAGTKALATLIAESPAHSIVGGGDTVAAIEELNLGADFGFISTGGGAMLDFLANGTLPGIEALKNSDQLRLPVGQGPAVS